MSAWMKIVVEPKTNKMTYFCEKGHEVGREDEVCLVCLNIPTTKPN